MSMKMCLIITLRRKTQWEKTLLCDLRFVFEYFEVLKKGQIASLKPCKVKPNGKNLNERK
jgi:hypothetical protein